MAMLNNQMVPFLSFAYNIYVFFLNHDVLFDSAWVIVDVVCIFRQIFTHWLDQLFYVLQAGARVFCVSVC